MKDLKITVVDYQAGNLRSVQKALEKFGVFPTISSDPSDIGNADGVIFPGQGACDSAMINLEEKGLISPISQYVFDNRPFLGICLGLQLLFDESEEGKQPGLGILRGKARRLPTSVKIPQIGWNQVKLLDSHPVFNDIANGAYFYFLHSYYAEPEDTDVILSKTEYGIDFCSAISKENLCAVQFHPEKSGVTGLMLYRGFLNLVESQKSNQKWI